MEWKVKYNLYRFTALIVAVFCLAVGTAEGQALADGVWPSRKGDAQGTSRSSFFGPGPDPWVAWRSPIDTTSGPTIGPAGDIYVGTDEGIASLDPSTGRLLWEFDYPDSDDYTYVTAALSNDGALYGAPSRDTTAIEAINTNGSLRWSYPLDAGLRRFLSSPMIGSEGTVYAAVTYEGFHAINPDGTRKWFTPNAGYFVSSIVLSPDLSQLYIAEDSSSLYALNAETGGVNWSRFVRGGIRSTPAVADDGTIYVGTDSNSLIALDQDGTDRWEFFADGDSLDSVFSSPAIASDGTIVFASTGNSLYALNPDGSLRWKIGPDGVDIEVSSPVIDGGDRIYVNGYDQLYSYSLDGTQLWTLDLPDGAGVSVPALGPDGTLYVIRAGTLTAVVPEPAGAVMLLLLATMLRRQKQARISPVVLVGAARLPD